MELNVSEAKGTPNPHQTLSSVLLKNTQDEKSDFRAKRFDTYLDFMDPELESQW